MPRLAQRAANNKQGKHSQRGLAPVSGPVVLEYGIHGMHHGWQYLHGLTIKEIFHIR